MPRWIFVPLIGVTSLAALFIGGHSLFFDDATGGWLAVRVAGCVLTLAGNLAAILHLRAAPGHDVTATTVLLAGIGFITLGLAGFIWAIHLGVTTGDLEDGIAIINGLIAIEGALLVWDVHRQARVDRLA